MISAVEIQSLSTIWLDESHTELAAIFADFDNLDRSFNQTICGITGANIHPKSMLNLLLKDRVLADARVYSGFVEGYIIPQSLWNMNDAGFKIYLETLEDGRQKGVDMSMGIDAIECARQNVCDTIILVTGDGDFVPVVRKIRSYGKKVVVASFRCSLSRNLMEVADEVIFLDELRMIDTHGIRTTIEN